MFECEILRCVFQSIKLNGIGLYWNSHSDMYMKLSKDQRQVVILLLALQMVIYKHRGESQVGFSRCVYVTFAMT